MHSIAYGNPETLLGGKFLDGPWEDVAQAVQVSAYSLKSLAMASRPLMPRGGSVVGLDLRRHRRLAGLRLDGRGQGRARVDARATSPATSAPTGIRVNLVAAGPLKTLAAKAIPGFEELEAMWNDRAPLGWDNTDHEPDRQGRLRAALGLLPGHHRRDRARRRRLPRDGRLSRTAAVVGSVAR